LTRVFRTSTSTVSIVAAQMEQNFGKSAPFSLVVEE
jgi:hypothetical protein